MHWFVNFCFLTVPVLVGVAFTLCSSKPSSSTLSVIVVGAIWAFLAYQTKKYLRITRPNSWVLRWVILAVVFPLLSMFVRSLSHDPAVVAVFQRHAEANERNGPGELAPAAPSRHALSWREVVELLAAVQPPSRRFLLQLLTCLPPVWWLFAFGIAVWKGK